MQRVRSIVAIAAGAVLVSGTLFFALRGNSFFIAAYQDVSHRILPDASRSFVFGNRHFTALDPDLYDVRRAEYFFQETARLNPEFPGVYHQLARVSFLKGDFDLALARINREINSRSSPDPASYYIRALIHGFAGNYEDSAKDYEKFLAVYPTNWAAVNDYAWVLLKAHRHEEAAKSTLAALRLYPENVWLLNSNAIALHELGYLPEARHQIRKAVRAVSLVTEEDWLRAYPGNDPKSAHIGVLALQEATRENMHTIANASIAAP